jgi:hypothetical protein
MAKENPKVTGIAAIFPIEFGHTAEGPAMLAGAVGTSDEAVDAAIAEFAEETGTKAIVLGGNNGESSRSGRSVAFSSNHWNSNWEPVGPRAPYGHITKPN